MPSVMPPTAAPPKTFTPTTCQQVLNKYPILTAHLICESLGYLTPISAANAILAHINRNPFYCEWYIDAVGTDPGNVLKFGAKTINNAFCRRRFHQGYMAEIRQARPLVDAAVQQQPTPKLQSW